MPSRSSSPPPDQPPGSEGPPWERDTWPHEIAGVHGHAGYPSVEDLENRLRVARGEGPAVAAPLPAPDPGGVV
jgi:hypothetical protein